MSAPLEATETGDSRGLLGGDKIHGAGCKGTGGCMDMEALSGGDRRETQQPAETQGQISARDRVRTTLSCSHQGALDHPPLPLSSRNSESSIQDPLLLQHLSPHILGCAHHACLWLAYNEELIPLNPLSRVSVVKGL
jgi:hypothetical protein